MAKKKARKTKKRTTKRKTSKKKVANNKQPQFMVQLNDPVAIRRDVLESLRDVIVFMQGHEKFLRVQEEKMAMIAKLKSDVKSINNLIEGKLRKFLPQGKLQVFMKPVEDEDETDEKEIKKESRRVAIQSPSTSSPEPVGVENTEPTRRMPTEIEEMEQQLRDIENQLKGIQ